MADLCYNLHMSTKKGRYGINVKKWCLDHENDLRVMTEGALSDDDRCRILALHEKKLSWLMHERLVHLIVTFITVILVLFAMSLSAGYASLLAPPLSDPARPSLFLHPPLFLPGEHGPELVPALRRDKRALMCGYHLTRMSVIAHWSPVMAI